MNDLPNDILDIIYKQKHQLEMHDICATIRYVREIDMDTICKLVIYFSNSLNLNSLNSQKYYKLARIWTAIRNEGYITNETLKQYLIGIENHYFSSVLNGIDVPLEFCINIFLNDDSISFKKILQENKEYIFDAVFQFEQTEKWLYEHVK